MRWSLRSVTLIVATLFLIALSTWIVSHTGQYDDEKGGAEGGPGLRLPGFGRLSSASLARICRTVGLVQPPSPPLSRGRGDGTEDIWQNIDCRQCHQKVLSGTGSLDGVGMPTTKGNDRMLPFGSCDPLDDPNDPLVREYGRENLNLVRVYEGSGERIRRFVKKLKDGKAVKVAVIGGSVALGHGLLYSPPRSRFSDRIFDWIRENFPHDDHVLENGAVAATSVDYFSFCFAEHMPNDVDLVLTEFDLNSERSDESYRAFENLYRNILLLPSSPALIHLSNFALRFFEVARGSASSIPLSPYYDVPIVSVRNLMLPYIFLHEDGNNKVFEHDDPHPDFRNDMIHINEWGHKVLADGVQLLFRKQLCEVERRESQPLIWTGEHDPRWPGKDILGIVPRIRSTEPYSQDRSAPQLQPTCYSTHSAIHPLKPTATTNFDLVNMNDKQSWMTTQLEGSEISFNFDTVLGYVGMLIWRTGERDHGNLECWVDGNRDGTRREVVGWQENHVPMVVWSGLLYNSLPQGRHTLTCRPILGPGGVGPKFRIIALASQ